LTAKLANYYYETRANQQDEHNLGHQPSVHVIHPNIFCHFTVKQERICSLLLQDDLGQGVFFVILRA